MTTPKAFRASKYVKKVLRPPRHCIGLEVVYIPDEDDWNDVPNRLRNHKRVIELNCDTFIGIRFRDENERDDECKRTGHGRWNWAAVCLSTGLGCSYYSSLSLASGHLIDFDLSENVKK